MRKRLPIVTESPDSLAQQLKAETDSKKRQRLQALSLIASGHVPSRLALAALLAVHRHTIPAWLELYEAGGVEALLTIHKAPGKVPTLTPKALTALQTRLERPQGFASYGAIQQYLAQTHHVHLASSPVHALVRYKLKAKPKSPRRSHPKKTRPQSHSFPTPVRSKP
jgi:transposase